MQLILDPDPRPEDVKGDLGLVIVVSDGLPPAVYCAEGASKPDRHYLIGLAQTALVFSEEMDETCAAALDSVSATLMRNGETTLPALSFAITVNTEGTMFVLGVGDPHAIRREARKTLRFFTGGVRLDIP